MKVNFIRTSFLDISNLRFDNLYYIDPYLQSFYLVLALGLAVGAKNSMELAENFKPNKKDLHIMFINQLMQQADVETEKIIKIVNSLQFC